MFHTVIENIDINTLFEFEQIAYTKGVYNNTELIQKINDYCMKNYDEVDRINNSFLIRNYINYFASNVFFDPYDYIKKYIQIVFLNNNDFKNIIKLFAINKNIIKQINMDKLVYEYTVTDMNISSLTISNILIRYSRQYHLFHINETIIHEFLFELTSLKDILSTENTIK